MKRRGANKKFSNLHAYKLRRCGGACGQRNLFSCLGHSTQRCQAQDIAQTLKLACGRVRGGLDNKVRCEIHFL
jgi:hypothetical protein